MNKQNWLIQELSTFSRFGLVGISATLVHLALASWLIESLVWAPRGANAIAFLCAFLVSFSGHYFWSFSQPGHWRKALWRFMLIAAGAFLINNLVLSALLYRGWFSPLLSTLISIFVVPVITFAASRLWGFRSDRSAATSNR